MSLDKNQLTGTLVYVQLQESVPCYEKDKGREWKASIVVSEDDADLWDEIAGKQSSKSIKTSDFEKQYKIEPPFPEQKKQYVINLKRNTKMSNGDDLPEKYRPRVFEQQGSVIVDVTAEKLIANGSQGVISFTKVESQHGDLFYLKNILVTDLIEYVKPEGADYVAGSEFDTGSPAPKATPKAELKPAKKTAKAVEDEENSPF